MKQQNINNPSLASCPAIRKRLNRFLGLQTFATMTDAKRTNHTYFPASCRRTIRKENKIKNETEPANQENVCPMSLSSHTQNFNGANNLTDSKWHPLGRQDESKNWHWWISNHFQTAVNFLLTKTLWFLSLIINICPTDRFTIRRNDITKQPHSLWNNS